MRTLLCFGFGYCAMALGRRLIGDAGWRVIGTSRTSAGVDAIAARGFAGLAFDGAVVTPKLAAALASATHVLVSAPPTQDGDPVLAACVQQLSAAPNVCWLGYLSTVGVYGDQAGAWVDEDTRPAPTHERTRRRCGAEMEWLALGERTGVNVEIFRVGGIYGPRRNVLCDLKAGTARRIIKPGQVFNRIHVDDIATALQAAIVRGRAGRIYNLSDDEPASAEDVLVHGARLLGVEPPQPMPFVETNLSPMAASFYAGNRRVSNRRIKDELEVALRYPTYREGLAALLGNPALEGDR